MKFVTVLSAFLFPLLLFAQTAQGFFLDDWQPREIEIPTTFTDVPNITDSADTFVGFDFSDTLTKVSPYIFGHNVNTYYGVYYDVPHLLEDIRNIQPNVLRYPGGSGSNIFFWDRSRSDGVPDDADIDHFKWGVSDDPDYLSVKNFYRLRDSLNLTGVFVVNYAYARYGTSPNPVAKAAHYAADWVRADSGRTKFWEIGNENYGSWEAGYEIDTTLNQDGQPRIITGTLYGEHFKVFADSMRAAAAEIGSEIKIGAVGYKRAGSWNDEVMAQVGDVADFIIVHKYFGKRRDQTRDEILATPFNAVSPRQVILDALAANGFEPLPVAMTEWNISAIGSKQKVSFVNGIHAAMTLGEFIKSGYGFVTRWNLVWRYKHGDTHGLIAANRDNAEEGIEAYRPRAPFFYYYFFRKYFGDVLLNSHFDSTKKILTFASAFSNGHASVVLINYGADSLRVEVSPQNFQTGSRYYWYLLQGGSDNGDFSRKVYVNGESTNFSAGGPYDYADIPPYFSVADSGIKVHLPPYSVAYVLIEGQLVEVTYENENPTGFNLYQNYPNPFNPTTTITYVIANPDFIRGKQSTGNSANAKNTTVRLGRRRASLRFARNDKAVHVSLKIYDALGREVASLVNNKQKPGRYSVRFTARNLASGIYFARLNAESYSKSIKMILLK